MKVIEGNLLDVKRGIICHQVNTYGVMGAGLALAIKRKFPGVNKDYENYCKKSGFSEDILHGTVLYADTTSVIVANVFSQHSFDKEFGTKTDLKLIEIAFKDILKKAKSNQMDVYIPYKYGCGLAGGDWNEVVSTFMRIEKEFQQEIIVVKLPD
jgi:O-acetyl-ADP-ribose deacetylase (regulator of RNase III)